MIQLKIKNDAQFVDSSGPDHMQADLGLRCPSTETVDTVVYVDKHKMPRYVCIDAYAHLDLC